jgi:hypothetical protein
MNKGKDLTEVRSSQRSLVPDKAGPEIDEPTSLRGIAIKAKIDKRHRFQNLYRCLDEELLHYAWRHLNKSAASGVDEVTAQAYEADLHGNIRRLVERLKTKRYRAKLVHVASTFPRRTASNVPWVFRHWRTNWCNWPVQKC